MSLWILDADDPEGVRDWVVHWTSWPRREVFAHPEYLKRFAAPRDRCLCASWRSPEGNVLYPFLLRDLTAEPYCPPDLRNSFDIATPYGYGGPFQWGSTDIRASQITTRLFWDSFESWARTQGVVSEFIRFSLFPDDVLEYPGVQEEKQQNIVVDLHADEIALWEGFEHKVRKNVNKAVRSGVSVRVDPFGEDLERFLAIYLDTMERRGASSGYRFPRAFFETLRDGLQGQFAYFHALRNGEIISTELILVSQENVYSFLGGTDSGSFDVRPNDLLKYEIILWSKAQKKRRYVLGGGYLPDDGIFRHKMSFASKGCVPFRVGHRVFDRAIFKSLVTNKKRIAAATGTEWIPRVGYFPDYRA